MLRLLILLTAATAQGTPPDGDKPEPPASNRLARALKAYRDATGAFPPSRIVLTETQDNGLVFRGGGQDFRFGTDPDSDLTLVAPDDALRAQLKLPKDSGLVATSVRPYGSAWAAEIRENDVLLSLDGAPLVDQEDFDEKLKQAGEKHLTLELLRKGARIKLRVQARVQARGGIGPVDTEPSGNLIGVNVLPAGPALRAQLDIPKLQGLVVTMLTKDSPAERSGIKLNDVILTVAGQPQEDLKTLWEVVQKSGGKPITVEFLREGVRRTVQVTPEKGNPPRSVRWATGPGQVSTFVRPGFVQYIRAAGVSDPAALSDTPSNRSPKADASAARIDEMAAEIKELRKAIDQLTKTLEARK